MQALDLQIRVHSWALVQVQGDNESWCYTVGLREHFDHPELTLLDVEPASAARLVTALVDGVVTHGQVSPWLLRSNGLQLVEVHPDHLHGDLFGRWISRYRRPMRPGDMVQVLLPPEAYCEYHAPLVRRLDAPGPTPSAPPVPNRAERRRRARRGRAA